MISAHHETATPQIRPPVSHSLNKPDELALVGGQLGVPGRDGLAVERHRPCALMQDGAEPRTGGVTFNNEVLGEVRQL